MGRRTASTKLAKYRSMRNFSRTAEPSGEAPSAQTARSFVIQQHAARRMHHDFRLELDGVLLSWSVPKGPSLSPTERRLAVRTEDHPLDYASFEGVIPKGEYGGGTVVVWDRGTWAPEGDARAALANGKLSFTLHGEKLRGRWHLIKTKGDGKAENWLLFKGRDAAANDQVDIIAAEPASVLSGRTIEGVAAAPERVWHSKRAAAPTARGVGWDDFKAFSKAVVERMERDEPALYTTNMAKARRKGKIFLDYLRNGRGATFIVPYSPRARAGAPVAVPIAWDELAHGIDPATFTMATVPRRLVTLRDDPWKSLYQRKQSITAGSWRAVGGKR